METKNSLLYEKSLWLNKSFDFRFGVHITEYDMKSAGLSLIKEYNLLPKETISELDNIKDKRTLNVKIGVMCRDDKTLNGNLQNSFKLARKLFFEANELSEDNLISIKRDAFFVMDKKCDHTSFGHIDFVPKNVYTSYMRLNKLEFYINTKTKDLDIKGLGQGDVLEEIKELHGKYLLSHFIDFARMNEVNMDRVNMMYSLKRFVTKYRNRELELGYYRELNQSNAFRVYDKIVGDWIYMTVLSDDKLEDTDISFNYYTFINPMISIML